MKNRLPLIGVVVIGLLAAAYLMISAIIYDHVAPVDAHCSRRDIEAAFTPSNFQPGRYPPPEFSTVPYLMPRYENVTFPSRDAQITISAFFIPAQGLADPASAPAVIIVHGVNDCKRRAFVLTAAGMLNKQGFNVLAIDLRDHGDSTIEDGRQAGGSEEFRDVLGAYDWLIREKRIGENRVGLMGFSLGAATAMIATGEESRIAAVWEDSGFGDMNKVVAPELENNGIPTIFGPGWVFVGRMLSGDDLMSYRPVDGVAKFKGRPLYIVHGTADTRVRVENASDIAAVAKANGGNATTWITNSRHVESIFYHTAEYERRLTAFFTQNLP